LSAVVSGYLGAKLDLPPGAVERASVLHALASHAASAAARDVATRYFDLVERVRYAPSTGDAADRSGALEVARAVVDVLERERSLGGVLGRVAAALLLVLLVSSTYAAADQARDPYTIFHDGNAAYRAGDYDGAVREYERLRATGFESGELLYNLGNAYFKQGMFGRAILSYERARRLLPRDPDTRANVALARELAKAQAEDPPLWQRIVLAPAFALSTRELAVIWTVLWWSVWVAAWAWTSDRVGRSAVWTIGGAAVFVGASFAFAVVARDVREDAVVVSPGQVIARFEPSATGKEHFRLPEGAVVEIRDAREGWAQIARADGLRAWLPADSVEAIGR